MEIAVAEDHSREFKHVLGRQRVPARKADLDSLIRKEVLALETGRHRGCVVSHNQIATSQKLHQVRASVVSYAAESIYDQELCVGRTLNRSRSGDHCYSPSLLGSPTQPLYLLP